MNPTLSLKSVNISLINIDERNIPSQNYFSYISRIRFKNIRNIHIKLLVQANNCGQIIGYICSYNYNKTDGHIRIDAELDSKYTDYFNEALFLFCNYLYACFPIRKIYFEICTELDNKLIAQLKKVGFKKEACLVEDTFYNNMYCDKYIFSLDINVFFEVLENGK